MKFKTYQKQDLARLALHDGAILAWDKGLGKTLGMFTWALLKCGLLRPDLACPARPVLLVAPGDIHDQVAEDGRTLLRAQTTRLNSQADFFRLSTQNPHSSQRDLPPGFYLASYTGLALNGTAQFPDPAEHGIGAMIEMFSITTEFEDFYAERGSTYEGAYLTLEVSPSASLEDIEAAQMRCRRSDPSNAGRNTIDDAYHLLAQFHPKGRAARSITDLSPGQLRYVQHEVVTKLALQYRQGIGETRTLTSQLPTSQLPHSLPHRIKCVYSATLADLCCETFAAVAIDEGVKMKGEETIIGLGLRQMNPQYRLVLSGTPIKNRLPDIFRLAHWATGHHEEPSARWPYAAETADRDSFAEEFLLAERNVTKESNSETKRRYVKLSPQVCNIHRLWKLFGPIVLRRLKADIGEEIVQKHRHVIRVPMGTAQAATYRYHMLADYRDRNGMKAIGAQLQALRTVAAAPHCGDLQPKPLPDHVRSSPSPLGESAGVRWSHVSSETYIPKYAAALTLVRQVMERGEQIVLFSDLLEPLHALSARLRDAGVPHLVATGEMSPARRRKLSADFKQGPPSLTSQLPTSQLFPVLLASDCMAEGHSWPRCNNIGRLAFAWAMDKESQSIDRCHRINSVKDLNYHTILCDGTTDRVLENNLAEKNNTSDLVLDGHLMDTNPQEVSLAEVLQSAMTEFDLETKTIDERALEQEWPALRESLRSGYREWQQGTAGTESEKVSKWAGENKPAQLDASSLSHLPTFPPAHLPPLPPAHFPTCPPADPAPLLLFPTALHPWRERALRRRNLRVQQEQLALA